MPKLSKKKRAETIDLIRILQAYSRKESNTPEEIEKYRKEIHSLQAKLEEDGKRH